SSKNSIIILDGLEYLITYNGFYRTLKFLHILRDLVVIESSNLLVSLNPEVLSQRELVLIKRELKVLES
ncbi:MAG: DUF835 domain-containing protein, partial [Candidatus Methanofastidiosia archaeon]